MKDKSKKNLRSDTLKSLLIIAVIFGVISIIINFINENVNNYLISYGKIEKTTITEAYVQKQETVIKVDDSKSIIPIIDSNDRVAKNTPVAFYKDEEYNKKQEEIEKIYEEMLSSIKNVKTKENVNTVKLNNKIEEELIKLKDSNSITEYRQANEKIEEIMLEKINTYVESGEYTKEVKELLNKINKLSNTMTSNKNKINSKVSGIVSYKLDGLETESIENKTLDKLKEEISKAKQTTKFGIKVLNNFRARLLFEVDKSVDIEKGTRLRIRLLEKDSKEIIGRVIEVTEKEEKKQLTLEINDAVEDLVDLRKTSCEIVWWSYEGLKVPDEAIIKEKNISYVYIEKNQTHYKVPVKIVKDNGKYSIINNYTYEECEKLGIEKTYSLKIYDEIVLKVK